MKLYIKQQTNKNNGNDYNKILKMILTNRYRFFKCDKLKCSNKYPK